MNDFPDSLALRPAERRTVVALLGRYLPNTEVWAYGSRTNGNAVDGSDLDLVAFSDAKQEPLIDAIREAFEESDLGFRVDIMGWEDLPETYKREIERNHLVLAGRSRTAIGGAREYRPLGEFIPLSYGTSLRVGERVDGGEVSVFGSNGQIGWHDQAITDGPTVIVGRKGTVGAVTYSRHACWPIDTAFWYSEADPELCRFKYYLLRTLRLEEMNVDSAVPGLSRSFVHALKVSVPHAAEQRRIAKVLGALDDKIESSRQMSETLDQMARALFNDWFVEFGPTRAKMDGVEANLSQGMWSLFPRRLVKSPIGPLPATWALGSLGSVFALNPLRRLRRGCEAPYLDMANMPTKGHVPNRLIKRPFGSGTRFMNGDTLVARITPCLENGKAAYVDFLGDDEVAWGSTEFVVMRPSEPLPPEYGYCLARSARFRRFAISNLNGTSGRQRVSADALAALPVVVPPEPVAHAFGELVGPWLRRAASLRRDARALEAVLDALLPRLTSGRYECGHATAEDVRERC